MTKALALTLALLACTAQAGPVAVVLAGQSNMVGIAPLLPEDRLPSAAPIGVVNSVGRLQDSAEPYSKKPGAGVSLARSFALKILADDPTVDQVWLIECAVGGTGSELWVPGARLFDACITRARGIPAIFRVPVVAVLWHQGESDCSPRLSKTYAVRLAAIIAGFRAAFPGAAFVGGELENPYRWGDYTASQWHYIVDATRAQADAFVPAADLALLPRSQHHFDRNSLRTLGERYAEALESIRPALGDW